MPVLKLTKRVVDRVETPADRPVYYRDTLLTGFGLCVTPNGVRSFYVEKRIRGRTRRKALGRYGHVTVEEGRELAQRFLGQVAQGHDPVADAKAADDAKVTLGDVLDLYIKVRGKRISERTAKDYRRVTREVLGDWQKRPLMELSKDLIQKRHAAYGLRSPARANYAMRLLKSLFKFAGGQYEDAEGRSLFPENPVDRLSHVGAWFRIERRRTLIRKSQLPAWFDAVERLRAEGDPTSDTIADYLLLLVFTGLRRSEGMRLTWDDVDFTDRTLTVTDTKNREPLILPLSAYLHDLLKSREGRHESAYVFPGSQGGTIIEPRKQMKKVTAWSGLYFTLHDLRRTFITIAESLELSQYAIKHLVNHKIPNDVTAGYIVMDPERLRAPMEKITEAILRSAGREPPRPDNVLRLQSRTYA